MMILPVGVPDAPLSHCSLHINTERPRVANFSESMSENHYST